MGTTTDPTDDCIRIIKADGQQQCYLVLSESERGKGFVRPVRQSYKHLRCGVVTTMGLAIAETYARDPTFYGGTYCAGCRDHFPLYDRMSQRRPWHEGIADTERGIPNFLWEPENDATAVGS